VATLGENHKIITEELVFMAVEYNGTIGINGPVWILVVSDEDVGTLTISPSPTGVDLMWNQINGPWDEHRELINVVKITNTIQVAGSINGLFANLTRATSFIGLYHLHMVKDDIIATMDDLFFNTLAIVGYGMLGTAFWTVQVENEIGFLEIGMGSFEWKGLRETSSGVQGETAWIPTSPWDDYRTNIYTIHIMGNLAFNNSARNLFYFLNRATEITGITNVTTTDVIDIGGMFRNMWALKSIDLTSFDTQEVIDMSYLFANTWSLTTIDLSSTWSTSSVTNMESMFYNAKSLTTLDVSNWDTKNVQNMSYMFYRTSKLSKLNVSASLDGTIWDTSKVTDMSFMFYQCGVDQSYPPYDLDVSGWKITIATVAWMFYRDKENPNPVIPYDPENPDTYQRIPDVIKVDLTNWIPQWEYAKLFGFDACKANMFELGFIEVVESTIIQISAPLSAPGLIYPDCDIISP